MGDLACCSQIRALPVCPAGCTAPARWRLPTGLGGSHYPQSLPAVAQGKAVSAAALAVYPCWSDFRICTFPEFTKCPCVSSGKDRRRVRILILERNM